MEFDEREKQKKNNLNHMISEKMEQSLISGLVPDFIFSLRETIQVPLAIAQNQALEIREGASIKDISELSQTAQKRFSSGIDFCKKVKTDIVNKIDEAMGVMK